MSTILYAVHEFGGRWDDAYDNIVHLHSTHELATAHIERVESNRIRQNDLYDMQEAFLNRWDEQHPIPNAPYEAEMPRAPWPAGLGEHQITAEMRAQRQAAEDHNQGVWRRRNEFNAIHTNRREEIRLEFLRSLGLEGNELASMDAWRRPSWLKESKYTIDEMDLD